MFLCAVAACSPGPTSDDSDATTHGDAPSSLDTGSHIGPGGLTILSITPNRGPLEGGEEVDIAGAAFFTDARVFFGQNEAEITFRAGTSHLFATPPAHPVPGRVDIRVENPGVGSAILRRGYTYLGDVSADSFNPDRGGSVGGTLLTVRGSGFVAGDRILVGERAAFQSEVVDANTIVALTPAHPLAAGQSRAKVTIRVRHASGLAVAAGHFVYGKAPRVTRVEIAVLPMQGASVILHGEALDNAETLYIGGAKADLAVGTASSSRGATVPPTLPGAAPGAVDLLITGPFGHTVLSPALAYVDGTTLRLFGVTPANGSTAGGDTIRLLADLAGSSAKKLRVGGQEVAIEHQGGDLRAVMPSHAAGVVDLVLVTDKGEVSRKAAYRYWTPPQVSKISPATGPTAGGQSVVLSGQGLVAGCTVRIGSWSAKILHADSKGDTIEVRTPPGAAGPAEIVITCGAEALVLPAAYAYDNGGVQVDALLPPKGATGGGTWVTVHGAGFDTTTQVYFDGKIANSLTVKNPGTITLKTPPHAPGAVAVDVIRGAHTDTLIDGFTYFSPTNPQGGTYGEPLQGTLNVTVLNIYTLKPVAQAFVQIGQPGQPDFPKYSGYTDDGGQIVFSGTDVQPPMTVSATKPLFSASSIVNFEVGNATLLLFPWTPPSSGGGGGPGLPLATLEGTVLDIDKYLLTPPTNCLKPSTGGPLCDFCKENNDCKDTTTGGDPQQWVCVQTGGVSARCFNTCQGNADCKADFTCGLDLADGTRKVCRPSTGIREITCQTGTRGLDTDNPPPGPGSTVDEKTGHYSITSRLDELAVYCVGGYRQNDGTFRATAMGVRRHVFPQPGQTLKGLDIQLNIPLTRTLPIRLDHPQPFFPSGNGGNLTLQGWIHLGSDGYVPVAKLVRKAEKQGETGVIDAVELIEQPLTLPESMTDTTYTWRVVADYGKGTTPSPMETGTQHANVVHPGDDNVLLRQNGAWLEQQIGVHNTLVAALPGEATDVLLVAKSGRLFRGSLPDVYVIWVPPVIDPYAHPPVVLAAAGTPTDATIVGENGLIRRVLPGAFGPEVTTEKSALTGHLRGVCHGPLGRVVVGDDGAIEVDTGGLWTKVPSGTTANLRAVVCTSQGAVAVGDKGAVVVINLSAAVFTAQLSTQTDGLTGTQVDFSDVDRSALGVLWAVGRSALPAGGSGVLLTSKGGLTWSTGWPAGTKGDAMPPLRRLAVLSEGTVVLADQEGGLWQRTALGLTNESPQRRNVLPMDLSVLGVDTPLVVGQPGLWLGPFLTVPSVTRPLAKVSTKDMKVEWAVAPGPAASVSRVHLDGQGFPFWWLYVDPLSTSVALPDFNGLENIAVFPPLKVPYVARVDRIFAPELSINGFSTFDLEFGDWRSWSTNGKIFEIK